MVPHIDKGDMIPQCPPCAAGILDTRSDTHFEIHPDQVADLAAHGALEKAQALLRILNQRD